MRTLDDKEGEKEAAAEIIAAEARALPKGIFTGNAGILSPRAIEQLSTREMGKEFS